MDLIETRLTNQHISRQIFSKPIDIVEWFGAIQAQDYLAAKWAIGLRLKNGTDQIIEDSFCNGEILRTHVLRPTWHFVSPADIRWMLKLTAPRIKKANGYQLKKVGLNAQFLSKCNKILEKVLSDNKKLIRSELLSEFKKESISFKETQVLGHILMNAELEGIICSGGRKGKQFAYTLLDEQVPVKKNLNYNESLIKLVRKYFQSHGFATAADFAWWSGLTSKDAHKAIELIKHELISEKINQQIFWSGNKEQMSKKSSLTYLLPNYDEYIVGYTDRSGIFDPSFQNKLGLRNNVIFENNIIINGKVSGNWRRTLKKDEVTIYVKPFFELNKIQKQGLLKAGARYAQFLGLNFQIKYV